MPAKGGEMRDTSAFIVVLFSVYEQLFVDLLIRLGCDTLVMNDESTVTQRWTAFLKD